MHVMYLHVSVRTLAHAVQAMTKEFRRMLTIRLLARGLIFYAGYGEWGLYALESTHV
jgi:hypothetical protein